MPMKQKRGKTPIPHLEDEQYLLNCDAVVQAFLRAVAEENPKPALLGIRQYKGRLWLVASRAEVTQDNSIVPDTERSIHSCTFPLKLLPDLLSVIESMGHGLLKTIYGADLAKAIYERVFKKKIP